MLFLKKFVSGFVRHVANIHIFITPKQEATTSINVELAFGALAMHEQLGASPSAVGESNLIDPLVDIIFFSFWFLFSGLFVMFVGVFFLKKTFFCSASRDNSRCEIERKIYYSSFAFFFSKSFAFCGSVGLTLAVKQLRLQVICILFF